MQLSTPFWQSPILQQPTVSFLQQPAVPFLQQPAISYHQQSDISFLQQPTAFVQPTTTFVQPTISFLQQSATPYAYLPLQPIVPTTIQIPIQSPALPIPVESTSLVQSTLFVHFDFEKQNKLKNLKRISFFLLV